MNFKIDTKEKFHVITINESTLSANMTEDLRKLLTEVTQNHVKHIILNFMQVQQLDMEVAEYLSTARQEALEDNRSFVVCELQPAVKKLLMQEDLLDILNVTPTESEAWDIVQMEEIERELLGGGE
ncbi:MAG: STAS domain-containing protein [Chitinophagaceae bacterium]|nr:STAS domain-containing protein [Chitinophagaceae bacterium]